MASPIDGVGELENQVDGMFCKLQNKIHKTTSISEKKRDEIITLCIQCNHLIGRILEDGEE